MGRPIGITQVEVNAIRAEYLQGSSYRQLSRRHGLSHGTIGHIIRGTHPLIRGRVSLSRRVGRYRKEVGPVERYEVVRVDYVHPLATGECMHERQVEFNLAAGIQRHVTDLTPCDETIKLLPPEELAESSK